MTTTKQTRAALMQNNKTELADEVLAFRQRFGELETTKGEPDIASVSGNSCVSGEVVGSFNGNGGMCSQNFFPI